MCFSLCREQTPSLAQPSVSERFCFGRLSIIGFLLSTILEDPSKTTGAGGLPAWHRAPCLLCRDPPTPWCLHQSTESPWPAQWPPAHQTPASEGTLALGSVMEPALATGGKGGLFCQVWSVYARVQALPRSQKGINWKLKDQGNGSAARSPTLAQRVDPQGCKQFSGLVSEGELL